MVPNPTLTKTVVHTSYHGGLIKKLEQGRVGRSRSSGVTDNDGRNTGSHGL